ncbi:MAG: MFS transporter [Geodermatophilaceae bacterium]|nr:MFS transporter [Geodermatophilaceae bacterium]MDQ3454736.1 MFS transporter [Actinomycetota bacterium]
MPAAPDPVRLIKGDADTGPPRRLGIVLLVISAAQLMVVLDATIVNIALPSIRADLQLSDASLQWVITSYTLAFGGLLLLGGRAGDILGRKRVFIFGILLFTLGSLLGGLAWNEMTLLGGRVIQGIGAAIAAPTALSLVATEFPEGKPRNQAMAVYAAMSGAGAAIGLILGGVLTDLLNWRWVLFVNVPIGLFIAFVAPRVLHETEKHTGLFDLPGALTATAGLSTLVYGLTHAATDGWSDTVTIVALAIAVALLAAFFVIETRSPHALMPMRIFADPNRTGAYAIMLIIGAAMFAMFFFLTLFVQGILGYSPLKSGFAFLPVSVFIVISAGISSVLITKVGPRVLTLAGTAITAIGMFWLAQIDVTTTYVSGLLFPTIVLATGLGFTFMPLTLAAVSRVENRDAGLASGVLNTTQQIGGALGLATLSTIAISAATRKIEELASSGAATSQEAAAVIAQVEGYSTALLVASAMAAAAFVVTFFTIKIRAEEVVEAQPAHVG